MRRKGQHYKLTERDELFMKQLKAKYLYIKKQSRTHIEVDNLVQTSHQSQSIKSVYEKLLEFF